MSDNDPELVRLVEALSQDPTRAVLVKAYPYRVASIRAYPPYNHFDIEPLYGLRDYLAEQAGWHWAQNHSVFVFDFEGKRYAIFFHDFTVRFGKEEDVFEVSSG